MNVPYYTSEFPNLNLLLRLQENLTLLEIRLIQDCAGIKGVCHQHPASLKHFSNTLYFSNMFFLPYFPHVLQVLIDISMSNDWLQPSTFRETDDLMHPRHIQAAIQLKMIILLIFPQCWDQKHGKHTWFCRSQGLTHTSLPTELHPQSSCFL